MATRKMTFAFPEELATLFVRRVPARSRSKYLAEALREKLSERDQKIGEACRAANADPEVRAIEEEFDAIAEEGAEPWTRPTARRRVVGAARSNPRRGNS